MNSRVEAAFTKSGLAFVVAFAAGAVATPVAILAAALMGWLAADASHVPPRWESAIGQAALEASLAVRSKGLTNPVDGRDADLLAGLKRYRSGCAGCHGDYGQHRAASGFYPPAPQFAQHPPGLTPPQMFVAVKYGIRYTGMAAWDKSVSDETIWQTVTFLARLNSLPPAVSRAWTAKR